MILACKDGNLYVDQEIFLDSTPVLARLTGHGEFGEPVTDDMGRLTFPIQFGISRDHMIECISFIRCGYVKNWNTLIHTFNILGGCEKLDIAYEKHKANKKRMRELQEERTMMAEMNPMCPEENVLGKYVFDARIPANLDDGWFACKQIEGTSYFWCRKAI